MKMNCIVIVLITLSFASAQAQENCLNKNQLTQLDAEWEKALLNSDVNRLQSLLAEDFIWIHDHASSVDSKSSLIKRASDPSVGASGNPRSRTSIDVKVIVMGSTGIVTGFTAVDRGSTVTNYNYMRTYVESEGKCFLLANHTMVVPEKKD